MSRVVHGPLRASVCLVLIVPLLASAPAAAAPVRSDALVGPAPAPATVVPRANPEARPRTGRGLLIAGGVVAGLGLAPMISGIHTRVKYGPCGSSGGFCLDGTGQLAAGGVMIGIGAILLTVGGVRYHRYKRSRATARLLPHAARTAHGGAIAGLQLQF